MCNIVLPPVMKATLAYFAVNALTGQRDYGEWETADKINHISFQILKCIAMLAYLLLAYDATYYPL